MRKIAVGFIIFAGLALFILSKGGDIHMGGETHGIEPGHEPTPATSAPVVAPVTTPESATSAPAADAK